MSRDDTAPCYCHETSTRNCPRHQNTCSCCPDGEHDSEYVARAKGAVHAAPSVGGARPVYTWGDAPPVIFEAWGDPDHGASTITTADNIPGMVAKGLLEETAAPLFSLRAYSWREAMETYHELQGWEPYVPFPDDPCRNCGHARDQHHDDEGGRRAYQCHDVSGTPANVRCGCRHFIEPLVGE